MRHLVEKPCVVEAIDGVVIVECGTADTTLTDSVAKQAGAALLAEDAKADQQPRTVRTDM